jgi:hypothetical protein
MSGSIGQMAQLQFIVNVLIQVKVSQIIARKLYSHLSHLNQKELAKRARDYCLRQFRRPTE